MSGAFRAGFAAVPVAGSGLDRKFRAILRHADGCSSVGNENNSCGAVSRSDRGEGGVRFQGVGKVADGAGGRVGAHECAGYKSERDAGAFWWNADSGGGSVGGITASQLVFGVGAVTDFGLGNLVAVDLDYQQQIGYVGSGISAAYVSNPAAVNNDANYVRRVTFNVGRVVRSDSDFSDFGAATAWRARPRLARRRRR